MRNPGSFGRRLLAVFALLMSGSAGAEDPIPCEGKNHYILREPCILEMRLTWSPAAAPLAYHGPSHAATLLADGRVLVIGSGTYYDVPAGTWRGIPAAAEVYDPARDSWSPVGVMGQIRGYGVQAVRLFDGRVLVLGGESLYALTGRAELFDPASGTFAPAAMMVIPRVAFTATLLPDGSVLVAGGVDRFDAPVRAAEIYDPASGRWRLAGAMREPRWGHTATALANGKVLVVGGNRDDWVHEAAEFAEVFDPATNTWTEVGGPVRAWLHSATILPDGRVVVAGGTRHECPSQGGMCSEESSNAAYVFDPATNAWSASIPMMSPRHGHLAVALGRRGSVLLVGGRLGVAPVPNYVTAPVQRLERFGFGPNRWQGVASTNEPPPNLDEFDSATRLADGTILLVGGRGEGRAALLR